MKRITNLWLVVTVLTASCQSDGFFKREVRRLEGLSESRLVSRFGLPECVIASTVGNMVSSPDQWRAPIPQVISLYPTSTPGNTEVELKSLSWPRGRILLTVWLHKQNDEWVSFYAEEWNMDVLE